VPYAFSKGMKHMSVYRSFKNTKTGELRQVKVGFSWTLLFFSGFLGLPLFLRRLNMWGGIFLGLWVLNLVVPTVASSPSNLIVFEIAMFLACLILQVYLGFQGNDLTAKNYLEMGWESIAANADPILNSSPRQNIPVLLKVFLITFGLARVKQ
jgi:hypothetical protein